MQRVLWGVLQRESRNWNLRLRLIPPLSYGNESSAEQRVLRGILQRDTRYRRFRMQLIPPLSYRNESSAVQRVLRGVLQRGSISGCDLFSP